MKRLDTKNPDFAKAFDVLVNRQYSASPEIAAAVTEIIEKVRNGGDAALDEFCRKFDGREDGVGEVPKERLAEAAEKIDEALMGALKICAERVRTQSERELPRRIPDLPDDIGITLGQRLLPVRRAGLYVPGGRASYPSSLIMAAIPAQVAGVQELIVVSPLHLDNPKSEAVLAAAHLMNVEKFFLVGGAHAVAALAFGTARIPRVDVIVGPGNAYVTEAKRRLYGTVNVDGVAGPTEIVIIADQSLPPAFAAADLMAQAEHGAESRCILMTASPEYANDVEREIGQRIKKLSRAGVIAKSLADFGAIVIVRDLDEAAILADAYAPEHLELACEDEERLLAKIRNAGAVFMGRESPETLGDYMAGSNHILPTAGTARFFSPLSSRTFLRSMNVVRGTREGLEKLEDPTVALAQSEGLDAHLHAFKVRLESPAARQKEPKESEKK